MTTAKNAGFAFADTSPKSREQDVVVTPIKSGGYDDGAVKVTHPAFGRIKASRVSGQSVLAGVDWPQQHYVTLSISTAHLDRHLSRDWWHSDSEVIEVALSEVQWAQMLTGMNTEGTVCTIQRYNPKPLADYFGLMPAIPPRAGEDYHHKAEAQAAADKAMAKVAEAEKMLRDLLSGSGSITKGKLNEVLDALTTGRRSATESLPFVVDSAVEAMEETAVKAKAEVSAFINHAFQQIGERATGAYLAHQAAQGKDPGQALIEMIAPPIDEAHALEDRSGD